MKHIVLKDFSWCILNTSQVKIVRVQRALQIVYAILGTCNETVSINTSTTRLLVICIAVLFS